MDKALRAEGYDRIETENGAELKMRPELQRFFEAVEKDDLEEVKKLLAAGASAESINLAEGGRTAVHIASFKSKLRVLSHLLSIGANPDAQTEVEETPMMLACCACNIAAAKRLARSGASISNRDWQGGSAVEWALSSAGKRKWALVAWLEEAFELDEEQKESIEKQKKLEEEQARKWREFLPPQEENGEKEKRKKAQTLLFDSARGGGAFGLLRALSEGADIDLPDWGYCERTALIQAVELGKMEAVRFLHGQGADLNAQDEYGMSAAMMACLCGRTEEAIYLIDVGARLDLEDERGHTALGLALRSENREEKAKIIQYLEENTPLSESEKEALALYKTAVKERKEKDKLQAKRIFETEMMVVEEKEAKADSPKARHAFYESEFEELKAEYRL